MSLISVKTSHCLWFFLLTSALTFAGPTTTPSKDAKEDVAKFEEQKKAWPKSVDEAVTRILPMLLKEDRAFMIRSSKKELERFRYSLGTDIRVSFGLLRGNKALLDDCNAQDPFDASMVILEAVQSRLQKEKK